MDTEKTKIVFISASPRTKSTYYTAQQAMAAAAEFDPRIEVELISFAGKRIEPCIGCDYCKKNKCWCILKDDMQEMFDKLATASGVFVVSPVYVMAATPQLHAFCSRMRPAMHSFPELLRNKFFAAAAVGGTRNGGQEAAIADITNLFGTRAMNLVSNENGGYTGGKVWTQDKGAEGAAADVTGMKTVTDLARKLAEVCLIYDLGKRAYLSQNTEHTTV